MNQLSIRLRLTLMYFCFFAVAGLLLSGASWLLLQRSLDSLMLHELDERIDDLEAFLSTHGPYASLTELRDELFREYKFKDEGKWLEVSTTNEEWLYFSSRGAVGRPIPSFPQGHAASIPFVPSTGHSLRTLTRTVHANGQTYLVSMAISADSSVSILKHFRSDLLLLVPVVLLAAAIVGHFLSRKALAPVTAIVTDVRRINDRNLATRLPVLRTHDELSLLSETLNLMLERIDSAFRSVRSLTANASHELRTPLSLIRTRVEIALCFPRTNDQYRETLEEVQSETLRMTALIENLLTIARYDAGAAQTELKPLDLMPLMERAFHEWTPTAERLSLQFDLNADSEPLWILGNAESLERVIRALIDNACRYTPSGKWIRLNCSASEDQVTIAVDDGGIGITHDDLLHIFERFYRSNLPQHGQQLGSGLGLSLVKWIVDQHKASIVVDSSPGAGSSFRVVFPKHIEVLRPERTSLT